MINDGETLNDIGVKFGTDKSSIGHDYLRKYEFFLKQYKNSQLTLIEIGRSSEASLRMWEQWLPHGNIVYVDLNSDAQKISSSRIHVEIGDSGNASFLASIVTKYGKPTVVVDDGSHRWDHQRIAFKTLFANLESGGTYIISALHTSFEPGFSGNDELPIIEILFALCRYLQFRGERADAFEKTFSKEIVSIAKSIESITFIGRSCIIKKNHIAHDLPVKFVGYNDVQGELISCSHPEATAEIAIPPVEGAIDFTTQAKSVEINIPPDYIYRLHDVIVRPRQVILKNNGILPDSLRRYDRQLKHEFLPYYKSSNISSEYFRFDRVIDEPSFFFDGEHSAHYGHFLLETLPRLWCFDIIDITNRMLLMHNVNKPFIQKLIAPFGLGDKNLIQLDGPSIVRDLIVSRQPYVLERTVSANARKVFNHISLYYDKGSTPEKIYVSRSRFQGQRQLLNEKEVEEFFANKGYSIIYPEALTVDEQVNVFGNARFIVGASGSAMYNLVFGRRKEKVLILVSDRFITLNDALINHGSGCEVRYVSGVAINKDESGMKAQWVLDMNHLRSAVHGFDL